MITNAHRILTQRQGSNLFLDQYPGLQGYSLRKISRHCNSPITLVNSSGESINLGFDSNGNLDTATALSFCGIGNGQISTLKEQSGSGLDLSQTTQSNMPYLIIGGVLQTLNGLPCLTQPSYANTQGLIGSGSSFGYFVTPQLSALVVGSMSAALGYGGLLSISSLEGRPNGDDSVPNDYGTSDAACLFVGGSSGYDVIAYRVNSYGQFSAPQNTQFFGAITFDGSNVYQYLNGSQFYSQSVSQTFNSETIGLGTRLGNNATISGHSWNGSYQEMLIIPNQALSSAQISQITALQHNYYG